jgi:putative transposase
MTDSSTMYRWRRMSGSQRTSVLELRRQEHRPWHSPPHFESDTTTYYMVTAACFEHCHIIGESPERISDFERRLFELVQSLSTSVFAWNILPNHYHALVDTPSIKTLLTSLGRLHGKTSFEWNGEDNRRGRQVWFNAAETCMKSEGHYYASLNYVLHNAVHHGYVVKWTDWPYCNATEYIDVIGRERALKIWKNYPLHDYGKDWDPPEL